MVITKSISSILRARLPLIQRPHQQRLRQCWLAAAVEEEVVVAALADMFILLPFPLAPEAIPLLLEPVEFKTTEEALRLAR
jgi:hypothetical protein